MAPVDVLLTLPHLEAKELFMVLHAGSREGLVPNSIYLYAKIIGDARADSHDDMTAQVFERWFECILLQNLPKDRKCVIVLDNASYHSRLQFKIPNMSYRKQDMLNFMQQHDVDIPDPLPIKSVLLMNIKKANIETKFVIDEIARSHGHEVLRLPPYHCVLNGIELFGQIFIRENTM